LTYDLDIQQGSCGRAVVKVQNIIKLSAAVHELLCALAFLPYLAMVKKPKIQSCDLDLWPMTLKLSGFQGTCSCKISSS